MGGEQNAHQNDIRNFISKEYERSNGVFASLSTEKKRKRRERKSSLAQLSRRKILVVDQDQETFATIRQVLDQTYEVVPALTGAEALAALEQQAPALALFSEQLPDAQGLELSAVLKTRWPNLPLVFMVTNLDGELMLAALRAGCNDVLQKPLCAAEVTQCVQRMLPLFAPQHTNALHEVSTRLKLLFSTPKSAAEQNIPALHALECVAPRLQVSFLGEFRVVVNDLSATHWQGRKAKLLFAYLAINHKRRISREVLMETFWPAAEPEAARNSLNVALHQVRRALQETCPAFDFIMFKDECYFLNPALEVSLDVEAFKQHWQRAQCRERDHGREAAVPEFEAAANLYHGDFMEEEAYDGWASSQREHYKEIYLVMLDRISKVYSLNGKPDRAVGLCENILARDNCREDIHRRLMLCYYRLGKRDKALKQFKKCEEILLTELEVKPTRATLELFEKIKNGNSGKKKEV